MLLFLDALFADELLIILQPLFMPPPLMNTQTWTKGSEWTLHVNVKQTMTFLFLEVTIIHA